MRDWIKSQEINKWRMISWLGRFFVILHATVFGRDISDSSKRIFLNLLAVTQWSAFVTIWSSRD